MKKGFCLSVLTLSLALLACREEEKKRSCRELFATHYETYVTTYMSTMPDTDAATSRKVAEYVVDRLYRLDSTFVLLDGEQALEWMNSHPEATQAIRDSIEVILEADK